MPDLGAQTVTVTEASRDLVALSGSALGGGGEFLPNKLASSQI